MCASEGATTTTTTAAAAAAAARDQQRRRPLGGGALGTGRGSVALSPGARKAGPTAPFLLSIPVLALAATLVATTWKENVAAPAAKEDAKNDEAAAAAPKEGAIKAAWDVVRKDKRMLALGAMQARRHAATRPERVGAIARRRGARCFAVVCQRPLGVLTFHSCSERQCLNRSGSAAG